MQFFCNHIDVTPLSAQTEIKFSLGTIRMSKIEIPFFSNPGHAGVQARGTNGSNPWVDGLFYEAQWGSSIQIALGAEKPVYSYYFLKPRDGKLIDQAKLDSLGQSGQWGGVGAKRGIAGTSQALAATFKEAYQSISDVSLLEFKRQAKPKKASIWIANTYFTDKGLDATGQLLGSHEGLIDQRTGKKAEVPLLQTLNAFVTQEEEAMGRLGRGYTTYATVIHEAGHGSGLSHPHDFGLGGSMSGVFPGLVPVDAFGQYGTGLWGLTQTPYTIMSYKRGYTNTTITSTDQANPDNATTPMALDVAALQIKYGTNRNTRKDDSIYELNPSIWACLYDAGGNDWIQIGNHSQTGNQPRNAYINLRPAEMNAIRPHSGEPMEAYSFQHGTTVDFAINTLISAQTSMIGNPLGMGYVFAAKTGRALDVGMTSDIREAWLKQLSELGQGLENLEKQSVNTLQLLTSIKQYINAYEFDGFRSYSARQMKQVIPDLATTPNQRVLLLRNVLALSHDFSETVEHFYKNSFQETSGPNSYMADLARLQDEQQQILERSSKGIGGYPSYLEGLNGGLTIAAGILIENAEGGAGDDHIIGNAENNTLSGLDGDDVIEGYLGADILTGGIGSDVFAYANWGDSPDDLGSRNLITDFTTADLISLKQLRNNLSRDASILNSVLNNDYTFTFLGDATFSGRAGEVRFLYWHSGDRSGWRYRYRHGYQSAGSQYFFSRQPDPVMHRSGQLCG
jgi:hypothetical protein